MAVVCSSDSDEVCCLGSRKAGANQLWQRWNLPDEEGPPSIPTFERDDLFEDQYVMGLALDLVNQEQLTLVAGEEQFPPSPVLWCLTSHNSIVAWTAIHKKAKSDAGKYAFMRTNEPLPALTAAPSPAAATAFKQPTAASSAPAAPAAPTTSGAAVSATADKDLLGAAEMGDHDALMKALEDGAQLDAVDEKTNTALHWAAKCGRADDIEALTAAGAPLNAKTKAGVTPLIYAASEGWDDCVQLLLAAGADPTLQTGKGNTAREATSKKMAKADAESKPRFAKVLQLLDAPGPAAASGGGLFGAAPAAQSTFTFAPAGGPASPFGAAAAPSPAAALAASNSGKPSPLGAKSPAPAVPAVAPSALAAPSPAALGEAALQLRAQQETLSQMKSQISGLTELLQQQQISQSAHGKEQLEQAARREQAEAQRAAEAASRAAAAEERVAAAAEAHRRELSAAIEEARQQRARDTAKLDEMQRKLGEVELHNETQLEENLRLEEEVRAADRARQERQDEFLRMQRALSVLGPSRASSSALTPVPAGISTPASARADRGRTPGRTPGMSVGGAALSTPGASSAQRPRGSVSRQTPGSRANVDWLKGAMSPASGVDMLDRLEQRPTIANLPGPPRTPGLFFGCKR